MEDLDNKEVTTEEVGTDNNEEETVTLTKAELDAMMQKAGDKRVSLALKTVEKKQREAEKLRGMNSEDRREYELAQRELAINEKEILLQMAENKSEGLSILAEKGLDTKLVDLILDLDADVMFDKIKLLEKAFKNSVKAEVEKRISGNTPRKSATIEESLTKEKFRKMSLAEQNELFKNNRELYNSLSK